MRSRSSVTSPIGGARKMPKGDSEPLQGEGGMIIRGTHDDATIEQMQHVAASAAYTALMADGHPGVLQPLVVCMAPSRTRRGR